MTEVFSAGRIDPATLDAQKKAALTEALYAVHRTVDDGLDQEAFDHDAVNSRAQGGLEHPRDAARAAFLRMTWNPYVRFYVAANPTFGGGGRPADADSRDPRQCRTVAVRRRLPGIQEEASELEGREAQMAREIAKRAGRWRSTPRKGDGRFESLYRLYLSDAGPADLLEPATPAGAARQTAGDSRHL